jgi:hypothetical protein
MTNIIERLAQHLRLVILRALTERPREEITRLLAVWGLGQMPAGTASLSMLQELVEARGHTVTRDQLASVCAWLADQGLVVADLGGAIPGAQLTPAGADVALGRVVRPGLMPLPTPAWLQGELRRAHLVVSADDVREALSWLHAERLVTLEERPAPHDGLAWPVLPRALDVAAGHCEVEGVRKPSIGGAALMTGARLAGETLRRGN